MENWIKQVFRDSIVLGVAEMESLQYYNSLFSPMINYISRDVEGNGIEIQWGKKGEEQHKKGVCKITRPIFFIDDVWIPVCPCNVSKIIPSLWWEVFHFSD